MRVAFSDEARADLASIFDYIAAENPRRAVTFIDELIDRCEDLSTRSTSFRLVPAFADRGLRKRTHGRYQIFYVVLINSVEIVNIMHGARDYQALLLRS